jgi:hypothetical protein
MIIVSHAQVSKMAHPTKSWLLEPIIPPPPALPHMDSELYVLAGMVEPDESAADAADDPYPSRTWRVGTRAAAEDAERFATSDSEAPTVRPGALARR